MYNTLNHHLPEDIQGESTVLGSNKMLHLDTHTLYTEGETTPVHHHNPHHLLCMDLGSNFQEKFCVN